jgi:phenylacetate-CoA ligase
MVKYAFSVPIYRKKYKKKGINPDKIKDIDDITKLPFITKQDLIENYPNKIIPFGFNQKNGFAISTSGSTGKPVFIFIDRFSAIKSLIAFARSLKYYGGDWRKTKVALIIDTEPGSAENAFFVESGLPFLKKFFSLNNIKYIHLGEKPEKIIKDLNIFQPEFLGTDPNMFRQLAYLKINDKGENINPKYLLSGGSMLDNLTRKYIEKAFNTRIFDTYGTTEGGPLAFECKEGDYHINSDFVKIEFLDKNNNPVSYGKPGRTIITKLYGRATPIIRYTGINDIAIPIDIETNCGISSEMIKNIEGRASELIYLPSGKTLSPLAVTGIPAKTMEKFNSYIIKQFQIVQNELDEVEVFIVLDEKQIAKNISSKKILLELQNRFSEKIGSDVKIKITHVKEIQKDVRPDYYKVIVSKIKKI